MFFSKSRSQEVVDPSSNTKQYSTSSSLLSPSQPDSVFLSGESAPQSPNVPSLNSSRRRGKRTSDLSQQDVSLVIQIYQPTNPTILGRIEFGRNVSV